MFFRGVSCVCVLYMCHVWSSIGFWLCFSCGWLIFMVCIDIFCIYVLCKYCIIFFFAYTCTLHFAYLRMMCEFHLVLWFEDVGWNNENNTLICQKIFLHFLLFFAFYDFLLLRVNVLHISVWFLAYGWFCVVCVFLLLVGIID